MGFRDIVRRRLLVQCKHFKTTKYFVEMKSPAKERIYDGNVLEILNSACMQKPLEKKNKRNFT